MSVTARAVYRPPVSYTHLHPQLHRLDAVSPGASADGGREENRPQSRLPDRNADTQGAGAASGNHRQRTGHPLALAGATDEKAQSNR